MLKETQSEIVEAEAKTQASLAVGILALEALGDTAAYETAKSESSEWSQYLSEWAMRFLK